MAFSPQNAVLLAFLMANAITLFRGFRLTKFLRSHRELGISIKAFYHITMAFMAMVLPLTILMVEGIVYPQPAAPAQPLALAAFNFGIYSAGTVWAAIGVYWADRLVRTA